MLADYCVYLDAGHGAIDENGKYVTAPNKQFEHSKGTFHNGKWFYEGVWNRKLTNRVAAKLKNLGISHLIVSHEYLDLSLAYRVDVANWHHKITKRHFHFQSCQCLRCPFRQRIRGLHHSRNHQI